MTSSPILFNDLFIDYVKSIFFKTPAIEYSKDAMLTNMPYFYQDDQMVSAAMNVLEMRKIILQQPLNGREVDWYKANPDVIEAERIKSAKEKEKSEIDLANAKRIHKSYPFTRFAAIFSFIVAVILTLLKLGEVTGILPYHK